jgi:hypothetical protein
MGAAGIVSTDALLKIWSSTIAFNHVASGEFDNPLPACGGILAYGNDEYLSFIGSIIANNSIDGMASDVCSTPSISGIIGSNNLIVSSTLDLPPDTMRTDPLLAPLADNGGPTLTHLPARDSPVVDAGNADRLADGDQRGKPRIVGLQADIGSVELQPDLIFFDGFDTP